jgi:hypothetical protein
MAESSTLFRDHGDYEELALIGNGKISRVIFLLPLRIRLSLLFPFRIN